MSVLVSLSVVPSEFGVARPPCRELKPKFDTSGSTGAKEHHVIQRNWEAIVLPAGGFMAGRFESL